MAIIVRHSGNVAPTAVGAYGGGQGKRRAQDGRQALSIAAQQREAERARKARSGELAKGREFASDQAALQRKQQLEDVAAGNKRADDLRAATWGREDAIRGETREQSIDDARRDRQQEFNRAEYDKSTRRDDFDYEMSERQRQEYNHLSETYEKAVDSGLYTEEELAEIKKRVTEKQLGIDPMPRMKEKSPWPKGQGVGETWTSDDGKFVLSRDDKGNVKKVAETNASPTYRDRIDAYNKAIELSMETVMDEKGRPTEKTTPNMEQAEELFRKILGMDEDGGGESGVEGEGGELPFEGAVDDDIRAILELPEDEMAAEVKAAAQRNGVSEEIVWAMLQREIDNAGGQS